MSEVVDIHKVGMQITDGPIEHGSDRFWGFELFTKGNRAHFYRRHPHGYTRLCDAHVAAAFAPNGQPGLFRSGNFTKCKRCMKKINDMEAD